MSERTLQFLLYDSTLLDLAYAFNHCLSLDTRALVKTIRKAFSCLLVLYNSILQFQFVSNHEVLINQTFKSFWMIHANTIHILFSYTIIYGSLIIPIYTFVCNKSFITNSCISQCSFHFNCNHDFQFQFINSVMPLTNLTYVFSIKDIGVTDTIPLGYRPV